jgi:hypothetical protein
MHLHNRSCLARTMSALLLFGVLTSSPVIAESPSIRITSPHPGAVVHSGSELEISVDAAPSTLRMALLNGDGPTPTWATLVAAATVANGSATPPYRVSIQIPANASTGAHTLFAVGVRGDGGDVVLSPRVPIDIERPDEPKDMMAELGFQFLDAVGDTKQLNILARFEDGTVVSLSRSHRNVYGYRSSRRGRGLLGGADTRSCARSREDNNPKRARFGGGSSRGCRCCATPGAGQVKVLV